MTEMFMKVQTVCMKGYAVFKKKQVVYRNTLQTLMNFLTGYRTFTSLQESRGFVLLSCFSSTFK